jgi:phosphopantothenoylcysteine decarboxylase/phosphopantothenate--cysteine ligase
MKKEVDKEIKKNDVLIMSAAVADYKPAKYVSGKIKKDQKLNSLELKQTTDILLNLNKADKIVIGFALETNDELNNAKKKLKEKNLDMIVLNSLNDKQSGFDFDTNKISILKKTGQKINLPLMSKFQAANKILSELLNL